MARGRPTGRAEHLPPLGFAPRSLKWAVGGCAMFDHIRGGRLDQHKYPWISLSEAAVYLMLPDDADRALHSHDWEQPFERLRVLIESGQLTVYEGWTEPYNPIPKEDFFGVRIRYPTYPDDRKEDIRRAYQPGFRTFIDCDLSQPRNRYFEARTFNPKWRDLKIRSQQLIGAIFGAEAANKIAATLVPDQPEDRPHRAKPGPKPDFELGEIEAKCYDLMDHNGDFTPDDPDWDCQARLETALMKFCQETRGREPGASTLREKLPEWLSTWHKRKTGTA
jgi:hypothetical protein